MMRIIAIEVTVNIECFTLSGTVAGQVNLQ